MIRRLLIANRGEIAIRIARACREMGIEAVAVYSDADRTAAHVLAADRAVGIGPAPAAESYLNTARLIAAARDTDCDALHPGYGFLSESPELARACETEGLVFVGPSADVIARMGSKIESRRAARDAGLPVVPGEVPEDQSTGGISAAARLVGVPLLLKASAGGGGRGMRIVRDLGTLDESIEAARREATGAFGDGSLYVERLVDRPRHVEVQVFGDASRVVHLFERECSIQRRHQKVVEESPAAGLDPALRARMCQAAADLARSIGYRNAGTVEFLVEGEGAGASFFFLEMNTRLQVEHAVTELVTGVDLVRAQLAVAGGGSIPWEQASLSQRGHAIEVRVYAEDPYNGFLPQAGRVLLYRSPSIPGVRVDGGLHGPQDVSTHYDPLLAKLIAHGETRAQAVARAVAGLRAMPVLGIRTNASFLVRVLEHPAFQSGRIDTSFLERFGGELLVRPAPPAPALAAAAWHQRHRAAGAREGVRSGEAAADPWRSLEEWRG